MAEQSGADYRGPVRVGVVVESLGSGGAERLIADTVRFIDRKRFSLRVYCVSGQAQHFASTLLDEGIVPTSLGVRNWRDWVAASLHLRGFLVQEGIQVVHTHLFRANIIGRLAACLARLPVVSTIHSPDFEPVIRRVHPSISALKLHVVRLAEAATLWLARAEVVGVSEEAALSATRRLLVPTRRMHTVPNGIDTELFRPTGVRQRAQARADLGIRPDADILVVVARLVPQKGHETILRSMRLLVPSFPRLLLLLAGEGYLRPDLQELARQLQLSEKVVFLGPRNDVPNLLSAADLLVLPSHYEGFGLAAAEALACGIPVVASNIPPLASIVDHGHTGLLVRAGDPADLADAIGQLLRDPARRDSFARQAPARIRERFDVRRMVREYEHLYERLADPEGRAAA